MVIWVRSRLLVVLILSTVLTFPTKATPLFLVMLQQQLQFLSRSIGWNGYRRKCSNRRLHHRFRRLWDLAAFHRPMAIGMVDQRRPMNHLGTATTIIALCHRNSVPWVCTLSTRPLHRTHRHHENRPRFPTSRKVSEWCNYSSANRLWTSHHNDRYESRNGVAFLWTLLVCPVATLLCNRKSSRRVAVRRRDGRVVEAMARDHAEDRTTAYATDCRSDPILRHRRCNTNSMPYSISNWRQLATKEPLVMVDPRPQQSPRPARVTVT